MVLHLHIGPFKNRDSNAVPTSPLADDLAIAPLGPVIFYTTDLMPEVFGLKRKE